MTLFSLHSQPDVKRRVVESATIGAIVKLEFPGWISILRNNNVKESDIKVIFKEAGVIPAVICQSSD